MDILKILALIKNIIPQTAKQAAIPAVVLLAALAVGVYFKYFSKEIDHPVEQFVEDILETSGLDYDFSEDKKQKTGG